MPTALDPDLGTIARDDVVGWAASLAENDSALAGDLTGGTSRSVGDTIHEHHAPEDLGPKDLVVRLRAQRGGTSQHFEGLEPIRLQGMLLAADRAAGRRTFFENAAARLFAIWTGGEPSLDGATIEEPVKRTRIQQTPRWAEDFGRYFLTHTYQLIARPR
jgi:hypothetical protein